MSCLFPARRLTLATSVFAISVACSVVALAQSAPPATPASPAASSATAAPVYSAKGSLGGITYIINELKRNANGTLTLNLKIQGTPGIEVDSDDIGFSGDSPRYQDYKILDMANKKRYQMLRDSDGHCLCTKLDSSEIKDLGTGKSTEIKIRFPALPADVTSVDVELPHTKEPIEGVRITN